ncbi:MAG: ferredoxin [Hydrogenophaga sp.]|uniref:ferredoxin n=1 Tax=Hydrogenophaga sp. TaxID=1904254 RepID=UPI001D98FBFF|nr:ferredoxin [Hydrogenophaga sp.]MBX3608760.1 ferredoxin [Hydrogenophaga sp.]
MTTFVILTSKPGQFHSEPGEGMRPVEAWDYVCEGRVRARFLVAELQAPGRVRVIDDTEPVTVNQVPTKFLESFKDIDGARRELHHLCAFGTVKAELRARHPAEFNAP